MYGIKVWRKLQYEWIDVYVYGRLLGLSREIRGDTLSEGKITHLSFYLLMAISLLE